MYTLEFDGACEPINPGGIPAYGWALKRNNRIVKQDGYRVPESLFCFQRTNNVAEFYAVIMGLGALNPIEKTDELVIMGDSKLVINCVSGKWKTKAAHLIPLRDRAQFLINELVDYGWTISLQWIPREMNAYADSLSKQYC